MSIRAATFSFLFTIFFSTSYALNNAVVVSEEKLASAAGISMLKAGGNAVDAAVAVGYALAVTNSCCGNIGGGGFMTIHLADGKNIFLNFREKAPLKTTPDMYAHTAADATTKGYLAVGVPGTVLGLETALKKYGTLTRAQVMAPAITLAENGYIITAYQAALFKKYESDFRQQPNVAKIFLNNNATWPAGSVFKQPELAATLKSISDKGADEFYKGSIAAEIVKASEQNGGLLSLKDFQNYNVTITEPVSCHYRKYTVISAARPSSGGATLCEMLQTLAKYPLKKLGRGTVTTDRIILDAMKKGFIYRSKLGFSELPETTHYSIVDKAGNAVAVTYTLNGFFGARVIAGNTGFFLNDEMDDFTTHPGAANKFGLLQSATNAPAPAARPLSSMAPTIILQNNKLFMVLGSPGGPRIITSVLQTILNVIDFDLSLQAAVNAPRIHYQNYPPELYYENGALDLYTQIMLEFYGYKLADPEMWSAVEAIQVDPNGKVVGANDRRRPDGAALSF